MSVFAAIVSRGLWCAPTLQSIERVEGLVGVLTDQTSFMGVLSQDFLVGILTQGNTSELTATIDEATSLTGVISGTTSLVGILEDC